MKKIIIALIALVPFLNSFGQSDDTSQYTYYKNVYGNRVDRVWGNEVLRAPLDTIYSKSGLAILNGVLYVGNGTLWSQVTGGGSDSGFSVQRSILGGVPIQKSLVGSSRFILWDTAANNPGGITTQASRQKLIDSLNAIFNSLFKLSTDSVRLSGYTTVANKNKLADSLTANFNALIGLYKLGNDSVRLSGYTTVANKNKLADSLTANFNALLTLYKLKADSIALGGYTTVAHANKIADSLRAVFNTLLLGKVDTGSKANLYIINQGTGVPLLSAHDSFLVGKRLFDTARVSWKQRIIGTDTSVYALFDTTGLSGGGTTFDSTTSQGGGFHTDGFNQLKYLQPKDSTKYATFTRLYKTLDSLNLLIVKKGDSTLYSTFARIYKVVDSLNLVMIHKGDSVGVGYTTLARSRKIIDSLGALILSAKTPPGSDKQVIINDAGAFGVVPNFTGNKSTNAVNADTLTAHLARFDSLRLNKTIAANKGFGGATKAFFGGDSFSAWPVPLNATAFDSAYIAIVGRAFGLPVIDSGVSSTVQPNIAAMALRNVPHPNTWVTSDMGGFNDARLYPFLTNKPAQNVVIQSKKTAIINAFSGPVTPIGGSGVTRTGTFTTGYNCQINSSGETTNGAFTSSAGAYWEYTFTDSTVWVLMEVPSSTATQLTLSIDGSVVLTVNPTGASNIAYGHFPQYITGLSFAAHTLRVTNVSGGLVIFDCVGSLVPTANMVAAITSHLAKQDATGYAANAGTPYSDAAANQVNAAIDSMVATLPAAWPVYIARTENRYSVTTGLSSDHIHPNNTGHAQIAQTYVDAVYGPPPSPGSIIAEYNPDGSFAGFFAYDQRSGNKAQIAYTNSNGIQATLINNPSFTAGSGMFGNNTSFGAENFSTYDVDSILQVIKATKTVQVTGQMVTYGSAAGFFAGNRTGDTTKGYIWYTSGDQLNLFTNFGGITIAKVNQNYQWKFFNNGFSSGPFGAATGATVDIQGNTQGIAGRGGLKLGSGTLLATPEANLFEHDRYNLYFTDSTLRRGRTIRNFELDSIRAGQAAALNYSRKLSGDTTTYKVVIRNTSTGDLDYSDWAGFLALAGGASAPFSDATAIIKNNSDATKLLKLSSVNITTATTRTLTAPDWDGIIATSNHAQSWTGAQDMTGATVTVATPSSGSQVANKTYVDGALPGKFALTSIASVSNTVGEFNFSTGGNSGSASTINSSSFLSGTFTAPSVYRITIRGVYSTTTIPGNLTIRLKIGGNTFTASVTNLISTATNLSWEYTGNLTIQSVISNSATCTIDGSFAYSTGSLLPPDIADLTNGGATFTFATNTTQVIDMSAQWATANASNTISATSFIIEKVL